MKIWVDDIRPAPEGSISIKSFAEFVRFMTYLVHNRELLSTDTSVCLVWLDDNGISKYQLCPAVDCEDRVEEISISTKFENIKNWVKENKKDYLILEHRGGYYCE